MVKAQVGLQNEVPVFTERNLSGPRLGVTFVAGGYEMKKQLKAKHIGNVLSLFGKSFNFGGVSIPLNLVCVTSPEGNRFSFVFGYAITKSVSRPN